MMISYIIDLVLASRGLLAYKAGFSNELAFSCVLLNETLNSVPRQIVGAWTDRLEFAGSQDLVD